jgi:hypothetical protein
LAPLIQIETREIRLQSGVGVGVTVAVVVAVRVGV